MGAEEERIKVVIVGDGMVGKTCLCVVYTKRVFPVVYVPTVFENYSGDIIVDDKKYLINLWDTAGQEDYERIRPMSYPKTRCILMCYAVDSKASFDNVLTKWYPELKHYLPHVPIILVATKTDLRNEPSIENLITYNDGKKLKRKIRAHKLMECSAKNIEGLDEIFEEAVRAAVKTPRSTNLRNCCIL